MVPRPVGPRGVIALGVALSTLGLAGCGDEVVITAPEPSPAAVRLSVPTRALFDVGATLQLSAELIDAVGRPVPGGGAQPEWSSDDPGVLTVNQSGLVTAVTEGTTRVVVRTGGFESSEQLWVVRDLQGSVALVDVTVLPMDGSGPAPGQTVLVEDGRVTAIGPVGSVSIPGAAHRVDGAGRYLVPGLTDAHTHPEEETDFLTYLANGVTTIISLGNHQGAPVLAWRDQIAAGELLGPTIYATGRILDGAQPRGRATIVTNREEARAAVRAQVAEGADFLKVYNSLTTPVFEAIMDEAEALGVAVIGHGVREPGFQGILDGGVSAIAHMEEVFYTHFGSTIDPSLIPAAVAALREAHTWVMPNLSTFERVNAQWGSSAALEGWLGGDLGRYVSPDRATAWRAFHAQVYANRTGSVAPILSFLGDMTTAFHEGGVPFLLATDSPIIPGMFAGYSIHDDLRLLVRAGLSPAEALEVGTRNAGEFVAAHRAGTEPFGTVTVGARADLILLDGDPTQGLETMKRPRGVMVAGRYLSGHRLDQLLEDVARGWHGA